MKMGAEYSKYCPFCGKTEEYGAKFNNAKIDCNSCRYEFDSGKRDPIIADKLEILFIWFSRMLAEADAPGMNLLYTREPTPIYMTNQYILKFRKDREKAMELFCRTGKVNIPSGPSSVIYTPIPTREEFNEQLVNVRKERDSIQHLYAELSIKFDLLSKENIAMKTDILGYANKIKELEDKVLQQESVISENVERMEILKDKIIQQELLISEHMKTIDGFKERETIHKHTTINLYAQLLQVRKDPINGTFHPIMYLF